MLREKAFPVLKAYAKVEKETENEEE